MRQNCVAIQSVLTVLPLVILGTLLLWSLAGCDSLPSRNGAALLHEGDPTIATTEDEPLPETDAEGPVPTAAVRELRDAEARELIRLAAARLTGAVAVRLESDRYLAAVSDVNGSGRLKIAVAALDDQSADLAEPGVMADSSRLYRNDAPTPTVYLAVFEYIGQEPHAPSAADLEEVHRFTIGRRRVVSSLAVRPLHMEVAIPAAFVLRVVTREGNEEYWSTLTAEGRPTMTVVQNAATVRTAVVDMEGNGYLDFLRYQQVFEAGRGYDTLITWTRWTETGFEDSGTTNIVRNLNQFLDWAGRTLVREAWTDFADYGLIPADRRNLSQAGLSPQQMVDAVFAAEGDELLTEVARQQRIAEVVFPEIGRNPFPELGRQTSFRTSLRAVTDAHRSYFFHAEIAMQLNPFQPQQFFFRPAEARPAEARPAQTQPAQTQGD